ncbi:molybdenum cofactor biosysynthesis protein [Bacteroidota bacterium]|nr:molybdenum cofactor biosysynthesis protein [Bacteroidota bacterium]
MMEPKPVLSRITIYPIKSLDGIDLEKAEISDGGCLLHDREFAISDEKGNFIVGKTNPLVHKIRTSFDLENETVSFRLQDEETWNQFHLQKEKSKIQSYLSHYFGVHVVLNQNKTGRFMDIPDIAGVTVLSTASLESVSEWYENIKLTETRKRFRATLEIGDVPAFWEDRLFSTEGSGIEFKVGDVTIIGMSPRERCVVPTRNPETGIITYGFAKSFTKYRNTSLPQWSTLNNYRHHYYLTVNCYIPETETGKLIETGSAVEIIGERNFYVPSEM